MTGTLSGNPRRRRRAPSLAGDWLWLAVLLSVAVAAAGAGRWLERLDQVAYDLLLARSTRAPTQAVVLVAIDEDSLEDIGRWPWSRALHAALVDRIAAARPAALLLDLILAETDSADPAADAALAQAVARAGQVLLPVFAVSHRSGGLKLVAPHEPLARAAAGLGHIHLELDGDGVARRVALGEATSGGLWPHLALATLAQARGRDIGAFLPGGLGGAAASICTAASLATCAGDSERSAPSMLVRLHEVLIPFAGPPGHHRRVSYAAVLRGEVPAEVFAGRIVLVGATAIGLGDAYPTPVSGHGVPMPGVEVMANVIDALDRGMRWRHVERNLGALLGVLPVALLIMVLPLLSARAALQATLAAILATGVAVVALLHAAGWWLPPAASLAGLLSVYPLWSWRRLEAAARYLRAELARQDEDAAAVQALLLAPPPRGFAVRTADSSRWPAALAGSRRRLRDAFERRLGQAHEAARALRHSRSVFMQSLAGLPAAVVVCDVQLRVYLANDAARSTLGLGDRSQGQALAERLAAMQGAAAEAAWSSSASDLTRGAEGAIAPTHAAEWAERLRRVVSDGSRCTVPLTDSSARAWLVSLSPYAQIDGHPVGVVVTLVEVTELHRLQREEREFLQFLSHDLRSPQNAVLALVDLARAKASGSEVPELLARIERHAERSLALIDALLMQQRADRLSRAEFEQVELAQLMHDAADQAWPGAQARSQRMQVLGGHDGAWVWGSRELLLRAVVNLAHNASQYSGPWTHIELALVRDGAHWLCEVRDNGVGIAAEHVPRLFERHFRAPRSGEAAATEGRGLGLAFVHTVAGRHGGSIAVASQLGGGSTFTLRVPAAATPDDGGAADDDEGARDPPVLAGARADTR